MRVHHLVAGLMHAPLVPRMISHVLLCEHPTGLVLVDAGFSHADLADPKRLGIARLMLRPDRDTAYTARGAVEAAGFSTDDVTDIVLTHLDIDHVGGVADFPSARLHTTADEWSAATIDTKLAERSRYQSVQWSGSTDVQTHAGPGDAWRDGLTGHEVLPGITLVPMPGHTRGHAAVAVDAEDGLIVHAGDASFDASVHGAAHADTGEPLPSIGLLRVVEKVLAIDRRRIAGNHATLARLGAQPGVTVVNAHDQRVFPTT
ncbi:metallo-beta-lactamase domain protein [Aeromicrobium marinum DSM 15272]|uniref:Metallo-beta-lactamase domain protein n=1 Tax=Aeromicrobium marinum DSM 15272 TaxID=585531 RepID=E2SC10_9ACTN|nr:MBL fold metallo-hydrolase [Aeromicrobium marinum]EFQ83296.1 metallo-beta-lactamase domain protein [Aeromicrobium marinum DSM 15272]